jgi:hypothetical protein
MYISKTTIDTEERIAPNNGEIITADVQKNDVLCGRGGAINKHHGNIKFRALVSQYRGVYLSAKTKKLDKAGIAAKIVNIVRNMNPPGRFLKEDCSNLCWFDIGDAKAIKKAGQAMREHGCSKNKKLKQLQQQIKAAQNWEEVKSLRAQNHGKISSLTVQRKVQKRDYFNQQSKETGEVKAVQNQEERKLTAVQRLGQKRA